MTQPHPSNHSGDPDRPARDSHVTAPAVAHHFHTRRQQFTTAKLGMWIFLATEILMFGGLFCIYAVYRSNHWAMFEAGHRFLDTRLGAINTAVLIASSFTIAWAVRCAQLNRTRTLIVLLVLTFLGGATFMGIKFTEYKSKWDHGTFVGYWYQPDEAYVAAHLAGGHNAPANHQSGDTQAESDAGAQANDAASEVPVNIAFGRTLFMGTCASCHGNDGAGLPSQGADLLHSDFVASKTPKQLLAFVKVGRQPFDPDSKLGLTMPPRGGNPALDNDKLRDIVAYVKHLQAPSKTASESPAAATPSTASADTASAPSAAMEMSEAEAAPVVRAPHLASGHSRGASRHDRPRQRSRVRRSTPCRDAVRSAACSFRSTSCSRVCTVCTCWSAWA